MTEADTCRKFVVPWLQAAGWDTPPHLINEQRTFTDGRIIFTGGKARRGRQKRADYLLRYRPDFPIAVVEAKAAYRQAGDALQQAKEYAEILGLKFAYATNGTEIIEFDYTTGVERTVTGFPEPDELWRRLRAAEGIDDDGVAEKLLTPTLPDRARPLRYYQEIAVNRATQRVGQRDRTRGPLRRRRTVARRGRRVAAPPVRRLSRHPPLRRRHAAAGQRAPLSLHPARCR